MKPVGLRFKHNGEIMIVHQCLSCGKKSPNRIAGDDIPEVILALIQNQSDERDILTTKHIFEVREALYGKR